MNKDKAIFYRWTFIGMRPAVNTTDRGRMAAFFVPADPGQLYVKLEDYDKVLDHLIAVLMRGGIKP